MKFRPLAIRVSLFVLLLLVSTDALAQPFLPPMPRGARARMRDFRNFILSNPPPIGAIPVPGKVRVRVETPGVRSVTIVPPPSVDWLRKKLIESFENGKPPVITAGEALLLGIHVDIRIGGSFFGIENAHKTLQIAFCVDGTDSMGQDIDSLKSTLGALVDTMRMSNPDREIQFALVVYRDQRAGSGPVSIALQRFSSNRDRVQQALEQIETQTGAPYFEELVDSGLSSSLHELGWNPGPDVSRWIILCGDAPPYAPTNPNRRHSTEELMSTASAMGINVHSILCRSGFVKDVADSTPSELSRTANQLRPRMREFMQQLSDGTGGKFLDLSDDRVVESLVLGTGAPAADPARTDLQDLDSTHDSGSQRGPTLAPPEGDPNPDEIPSVKKPANKQTGTSQGELIPPGKPN